ncbi:MAG: SPFH domain-containing protein [Candidatus Bruticola sp.]
MSELGALGGVFLGMFAYVLVLALSGIYTLNPNERGVKVVFGRAERVNDNLGGFASDDFARSDKKNDDEESEDLYRYPKLAIIGPGMHFKKPWEEIRRVSIATQTADIGLDPSNIGRASASLSAVTKDQLNTKISGQIRFRVSENNLYAYLFGIRNPIAHIMGFFHSILREKIANYEAPKNMMHPEEDDDPLRRNVEGISINDLRKNLQDINEHMERECSDSAARYGVVLEAALITGIDPPDCVEQALAAINTAHNEVSSDISVAQADADQTIVQSKRAVEIQTLKAQAEVEPLRQLSERLKKLRDQGGLYAYLRNMKLGLLSRASSIVLEDRR